MFSLRLPEEAGGARAGHGRRGGRVRGARPGARPGAAPGHAPGGRRSWTAPPTARPSWARCGSDRAAVRGRARWWSSTWARCGALVVVADDGLSVSTRPLSTPSAGRTAPLDPLTPLWRVDRLPPGEPVAGPDAAAQWRRDAQVLGGALSSAWPRPPSTWPWPTPRPREQFGKPIGSFQAVKHLCADMLVRAEVARAAVHAAAVTVDQPDVGDAVARRRRRRAAGGRGRARQRQGVHPGARRHGLHVGGSGPSVPDAGPHARRRRSGTRRAGRDRGRALLTDRTIDSDEMTATETDATEIDSDRGGWDVTDVAHGPGPCRSSRMARLPSASSCPSSPSPRSTSRNGRPRAGPRRARPGGAGRPRTAGSSTWRCATTPPSRAGWPRP